MDDYTAYRVLAKLASGSSLSNEEKEAIKTALGYLSDPFDTYVKHAVSDFVDEYDIPDDIGKSAIREVCLEGISSCGEEERFREKIEKQVSDIVSDFIRDWKDNKDEAVYVERDYQRMRV